MTEQKDLLDQYREIIGTINEEIGFSWWKRYVAAAFWANVSTPLNLTITLITAVTTGQAASQDLISKKTTFSLSIAALIASTINTFFRPHDQMNNHLNIMKQWTTFGSKLDTIYYKPDDTVEQLREKLLSSYDLFNEINAHRVNSTYKNNFLTDLIHLIARFTCLKKDAWIKTFDKDFQRKFSQLEQNIIDEQN